MRFPKLSSIFSSANSPLTHHLIATSPSSSPNPFPTVFSLFSRRFFLFSPGENVRGSLTKDEKSVYSWLYSIAQSEKFLSFEYVQSTERGLSFKEADRRLREIGPNVPFEDIHPRWWCLLWKAFFHPFNIILIVLSVLSYVASDSPNGFIMLVLVFVSISLRFSQEFSSSKAATQLAELVKRPVRIQRCAGRVVQVELMVQIDQRDVVPGDIVIFQPGDLFPGDVRLLSSKHLVVSQSSLTGESGTVDKTADIRENQSTPLLDLKNICFMGTNVVSGSGTGLVVSTGSKTYISTMFSSIGEQKPADDFERGVRDITYGLIVLMLLLVTIIVLCDYLTSHDIGECILFGISVASALTPQMLPLVVNTSLAKGALAMAKHRCIVKSANAIRDMGSMDILCIDKTGTLTTDHGIVVGYLDAWGDTREEVLRFAFLNSYFTNDQKHPLDDAILAHVYTSGYRFEPSKWRKLDEIPFDFIRRRVSVVLNICSDLECRNSSYAYALVITKGALGDVLKTCSFLDRTETSVSLLTVEHRHRILGISEGLSNDGLRVVGVAVKRHLLLRTGGGPHDPNEAEHNMSFLGLLTFFDPPKDSAKQALCQLAEKGVEAKVLTGDSLPLAVRVCREVGMKTDHVITGAELDLLPPHSFHEAVERATVLARLTPTQKLRAVQSLQRAGKHVVGFLGDGINDSLALDTANVGISVDSGASIAKDCADIILLENDLSVLAEGVERGRATFTNMVKYIRMSIIANVGAAVSLMVATVYLRFEPLTPRQLLVQNFLYNSGQMAIPWDTAEEGGGGPSQWSMGAIMGFIAWNAPVCCMCDVGTLAFLWWYGGGSHHQTKFVRTALFVEGLVMQMLVIHVIRTKKVAFVEEAASWQVMCSTALVSVVGISLPYTSVGAAMGFVPLPVSYLGFLVALVFVYLSLAQLVKSVYILVYKNWL